MITTKFNKSYWREQTSIDLQGFSWYCWDGKFHYFQRREADGIKLIGYRGLKCREIDVENGNLAFMVENNLTA